MIDAVYVLAVGVAPLIGLMAATNLGRIADELKATREEQRRQFDLERQYPRAP